MPLAHRYAVGGDDVAKKLEALVLAQGAHYPAEPVTVLGLDAELARPATIEEIIVTFWQPGLLDDAGVVGGDENVQACADPLPMRQDRRRKERG
jgi:hypothetical protein